MYPLRYHELFGLLIDPGLRLDPARYDYYHRWGNRAYAFRPELDMDIADLLGVRWLYVRGDPLSDTSGLTARFTADGVTVYENAEAFPRAFIVHDLEIVPDRPALLAALATDDARALRNRVYLAAADEPPSTEGPVTLGPNDGDTATIEEDAIDRIVINARTSTPGYLVLADTYTRRLGGRCRRDADRRPPRRRGVARCRAAPGRTSRHVQLPAGRDVPRLRTRGS